MSTDSDTIREDPFEKSHEGEIDITTTDYSIRKRKGKDGRLKLILENTSNDLNEQKKSQWQPDIVVDEQENIEESDEKKDCSEKVRPEFSYKIAKV